GEGALGVVERGVHRRAGEGAQQGQDDALRAAALGEVVVDDGDAPRGGAVFRGRLGDGDGAHRAAASEMRSYTARTAATWRSRPKACTACSAAAPTWRGLSPESARVTVAAQHCGERGGASQPVRPWSTSSRG